MKGYLILLSFLGVVSLRPVGHKYYLIMTNATWPDAQNYCRKTYADLATVESELDWLMLNRAVAREGLTDVAWIGLYNDLNSWRWSFNDIPLNDTFQNWGPGLGQGANNKGQHSCGVTGPDGIWWDVPCTYYNPFICYNANGSAADNNTYVGVNSPLTWNEAQTYCRKFYTDLAIAFTETDNSAILEIAFKQGGSWIGPYRDTWKWSDGTNTSNLVWLPGTPNNVNAFENCAVLINGSFEDTTCSELHYFICHVTYPVRENQIIRLQVKSDVNMIDSDVQANILELVKQKLDENGMLDNTTVTWGVQSDGQIFYKKKKRDL